MDIRRKLVTVLASNLRYLTRDLFTTDRAAGAVNGTAAEPGPGTRTVTDTGNQLSIANGQMRIVGVCNNNDPYYRLDAAARTAGLVGYAKFKPVAGKRISDLGWMTSGNATTHAIFRTAVESGGVIQIVGTSGIYLVDDVWYEMFQVLRASGAWTYLNDGRGPRLLFGTATGNAASLLWASRGIATYDQDVSVDEMSVEQAIWSIPVLASDSFNRADGAPGSTDGAGIPESGGAGLAWTDRVGTTAIATNALAFSALDGGVGIATVNAGNHRVWLQVDVTRTAGNAGLVFGYTDASNYGRAYHDGTNVVVQKVVGGAATTIATAAAAYVAGRALKASVDELDATVFYGDTRIQFFFAKFGGMTLGSTHHGVYTTDTGNTFDNFAIVETYPSRVGRRGIPVLPQVVNIGDSLSDGYGALPGSMLKKLTGRYAVVDRGVGGQTSAQIQARFDFNVVQKAPHTVIILAGVNDAKAGTAAATIQGNLQAMYTAAHNAGIRVVAVTITPWKNGTSWSAGNQTITDTVNAWILNTATDVDYRIDGYTALEDPGAPDALLAAYDGGDHTHPNRAGYDALANAIYAGATW